MFKFKAQLQLHDPTLRHLGTVLGPYSRKLAIAMAAMVAVSIFKPALNFSGFGFP